MGANTYIGNGPNFMVHAIAEERGVKMPSFGGYMLYSGAVLLPDLRDRDVGVLPVTKDARGTVRRVWPSLLSRQVSRRMAPWLGTLRGTPPGFVSLTGRAP